MRLQALTILAAAAVGLLLPPLAHAQTPAPPATPSAPAVFTKLKLADLAKIIQDAGYRAEIPQDGSPRVITGMSGYNVVLIYLYSCDGDAGCGSLMFSHTLTKTAKMTLSLANKWNQEKRYAKAYLDTDGNLALEYDVTFSGGVTSNNVAQAASVYANLLSALDQFIDTGGGK